MIIVFASGERVRWHPDKLQSFFLPSLKRDYGDGPFEVARVIPREEISDTRKRSLGPYQLLELRFPDGELLKMPDSLRIAQFSSLWFVRADE